jgi:hypothetical protein
VRWPPTRHSPQPWPTRRRRGRAGGRHIVETGYDQRYHPCRLERARPPELRGVQARLAAQVAVHNGCIGLHAHCGRPRLAFVDLVDWESHAISHQAFNTLGYPKAALFRFCLALLAYNAVSLIKAALRCAQGRQQVNDEVSSYYRLSENVSCTLMLP